MNHMQTIELKLLADVSADKIWTTLADFGGFLNWAGDGSGSIQIEGEGVGMIRHLEMAAGKIAERLTTLDPNNHQIGYEIVYGQPIGMKTYQALVTVTSTGEGTCSINWRGRFSPVVAGTEKQVGETLRTTFHHMNQALVAYAQNN